METWKPQKLWKPIKTKIIMNIISIKQLAKGMRIRKERIVYKIQQLNLEVLENDSLSKADVFLLLKDYMASKKTSSATKTSTKLLIQQLETNTFPIASKPYKQKGKIATANAYTQPKKKRTRTQKWYALWIMECTLFVHALIQPPQQLVRHSLNISVQFLESMHFKFVALLISIGVQMHHSAHWFYRVTPEPASWYTAYGYAFMVDLFILVITLEGKLAIARTFAVLCFVANIFYFQFWVQFDYSVQAYTNGISCVLISGIMAFIIYAYTELFVQSKSTSSLK